MTGQGQSSTIWQVDMSITRIFGEQLTGCRCDDTGDTNVLGNYSLIGHYPWTMVSPMTMHDVT